MSSITGDPIWTELGPGYCQVQFASLKQFVDYLYGDLLDFGTYVWRGQRCDSWRLDPTIDRLIRDADTSHAQSWDFRIQHLDTFKRATRGRRNSQTPAPTDENEWWALGQHHGLATPLLDWTSSPFVAAFFAFAELAADQTPNRAVFALHQPGVEGMAKLARLEEDERRKTRREQLKAEGKSTGLLEWATISAKAESEVVFVRPQSDDNHRLVAQGGLFTRSRTNLSIEEWVMKRQPKDDNGLTLLKCLVPDIDRSRCLQLLNRMNINPLSLFPDLTGASRYCNLHSEIENY
ncbi:MAG: hypothetical protein CVU22_12355 [Betaproteobacteria bacterium HGW-Betaproteobacteria-16]|nr:MAG: hypothetical protein CVU22_12355 [Betaproteobacteria bacterium HGW-Betaproteobacteria-16]